MGACLASLVGGVIPERILSLSLIEGLGPFSAPAQTACYQLREYALTPKKTQNSKGYDRLEDAARARAFKGYVSFNIAKILCKRSVIEKQGKFYWRHDQRLLTPSPLRMTEPQILSCLRAIKANTYLMLSSKGFAFDFKLLKRRIKAVKSLSLKEVEGGHHIHMEQPEFIGGLLREFIISSNPP
jgi:pimeloyl-ACP methyl ester carboxylesterase